MRAKKPRASSRRSRSTRNRPGMSSGVKITRPSSPCKPMLFAHVLQDRLDCSDVCGPFEVLRARKQSLARCFQPILACQPSDRFEQLLWVACSERPRFRSLGQACAMADYRRNPTNCRLHGDECGMLFPLARDGNEIELVEKCVFGLPFDVSEISDPRVGTHGSGNLAFTRPLAGDHEPPARRCASESFEQCENPFVPT